MRIAYIVTRADSLGGAHTHILDLAGALLSQGHEVTVLLGGSGPVVTELERRGISFRTLRHLAKPLRPVDDLRAVFEIFAVLRDLRPDLVAAHTAKAGMAGRCAAAMARIPSVFTPHGWAIADRISIRQGRVFRAAEQLAGRFSARIINVCEYERNLARRHRIAPDAKLSVVHNGIADVPADCLADPRAEPPRLISVARFEQPKDPHTLLCALAQLKDVPWTLDFAGDGPLEPEIRRMAAELGIEKRLQFLGARRDIVPLLARSQAFVLSSRSEAFPYSVLEAMRAGLPIVASDVGGIGEAVTDGESALLAPARDVAALQACLRRIITQTALRAEMGRAGRRRYLAEFTLDKMLQKTFQVYREVTALRRATGGSFTREDEPLVIANRKASGHNRI